MKRHRPSSTNHPHLQRGLHPVSLMVLLCAGVFLVAATISAFGDSYTVTASVSGVPPSTAALITNPVSGASFGSATQVVSGSCPTGAYVVLAVNGQASGMAWCSASRFSIVTTLPAGTNQLSAQDYNVLDNPGPASPTVTAAYVPPTQHTGGTQPTNPSNTLSSPVAAPTTLTVTSVDTGVPYVSTSTVESTGSSPHFSGVAPPFSHVTVIVHSNVLTCSATADQNGFWRCGLPSALPNGLHTVMISAITQHGEMLSLPTFKIHAAPKTPMPLPAATPMSLTSNYHYQTYLPNQLSSITLQLGGGIGPYAITVNWGDSNTTTQVAANAGPLTLQHRYPGGLTLTHAYTAKVTVLDSTGHAITSQFIVMVRNPAAGVTNARYEPPSAWHHALTSLHDWLWLLWPAYLIVILMLVSFVLGERKQYEADRLKAALSRSRPTRHRHRTA